MTHWNENLMIAIQCEVTGPDPEYAEVYQLAALLLDSNCRIYRDVAPFNVYIKPSSVEVVTEKYVSAKQLDMLITCGLSNNAAAYQFITWLEKCPFNETRKQGALAQAFALGYDLVDQMPYLFKFLGHDVWRTYFHPRFRDVLAASTFINDCAGMADNTVPFSKNDLSWIATIMKVDHLTHPNALQKCLTIAQTYEKLIHYYGFNKI
jgi:hypothetical protein